MRKAEIITLPNKTNRKYEIEVECFYDTSYEEGEEVDMRLACALGQAGVFD